MSSAGVIESYSVLSVSCDASTDGTLLLQAHAVCRRKYVHFSEESMPGTADSWSFSKQKYRWSCWTVTFSGGATITSEAVSRTIWWVRLFT